THTFTLNLNDRPSALIELGYTDAAKYRRWLDLMVNTLSWSVVDGNQSIKLEGAMSSEVKPRPVAVWQAAPTSYAKNRACVKSGNVYDVFGASTIGRISKADVSIKNNMEFQHHADGNSGYGAAIMGQPEISGSLSAVFGSDTSMLTYMEDHTSVPLVLVGKNLAGDASLTLNLPKVEFDKPKYSIKTSKGLVLDANWRAHADAVAPTIVLVNGITTYAA
ncbi:MAG: phage tail tube protein, partial [Gammaproteobacteria bacterium]|nr:phage tail tube protein [Gammaproteobacteria bacterium]